MPVALERLVASGPLRIVAIANFEPGARLSIRRVVALAVLRHDSLEVQLTRALEQRDAIALDVIGVHHR
jgi:hypothetical protein